MLAGWWGLLAYDCEDKDEEQEVVDIYKKALCKIENQLRGKSFLLGNQFSAADIIMIPFMERQIGTVFYYKEYNVHEHHPLISAYVKKI